MIEVPIDEVPATVDAIRLRGDFTPADLCLVTCNEDLPRHVDAWRDGAKE